MPAVQEGLGSRFETVAATQGAEVERFVPVQGRRRRTLGRDQHPAYGILMFCRHDPIVRVQRLLVAALVRPPTCSGRPSRCDSRESGVLAECHGPRKPVPRMRVGAWMAMVAAPSGTVCEA